MRATLEKFQSLNVLGSVVTNSNTVQPIPHKNGANGERRTRSMEMVRSLAKETGRVRGVKGAIHKVKPCWGRNPRKNPGRILRRRGKREIKSENL